MSERNEMVVYTEEDIFSLIIDLDFETNINVLREILGIEPSSPKIETLKAIVRRFNRLKDDKEDMMCLNLY